MSADVADRPVMRLDPVTLGVLISQVTQEEGAIGPAAPENAGPSEADAVALVLHALYTWRHADH